MGNQNSRDTSERVELHQYCEVALFEDEGGFRGFWGRIGGGEGEIEDLRRGNACNLTLVTFSS